jgi:hypothetical protein
MGLHPDFELDGIIIFDIENDMKDLYRRTNGVFDKDALNLADLEKLPDVNIRTIPFLDPFGVKQISDDELDVAKYTSYCWTRVAPKRWGLEIPFTGVYIELREVGYTV